MLQHRADIIHAPGLSSAILSNTQLGWVIVGTVRDSVSLPAVTLMTSLVPTMSDLIQKFWSVEEPGEPDTPTTEQQQCEAWFQRTVTRDNVGRFQVRLPFRTILQSPNANGPSLKQTYLTFQSLG